MRIALVFPPSMPPLSPPCGIAYLKAFLGTGRNFDLNVLYHDVAVQMLLKGDITVEADLGGEKLEPEDLKEAIRFLKEEFYDEEEYNRSVGVFFSYFTEISSLVVRECVKYLMGEDNAVLELVDRILSPVENYHPEVVGFSQMVLDQREFVLSLANRLKENDIPLVLGGASLWYNPQSYLSQVYNVELSHLFDAVFYGEGEIPLKMYVDGESLEKIPGVVYRRDILTKHEVTGVEELDSVPPPDFGDFPLKDYYTPCVVLPLLTSRGCYWKRCTFCTHYSSYYEYRTRSVERVIEDIKEMKRKYGMNHFLFADEMVHPRRFDALSRAVSEEGLDMRCYAEVKPTKEFTRDVLKRMHGAGVRALIWGVESGSQRILDAMDKGTRVEEIERVLKEGSEAGIWNMVFIMGKFPGQTREEVEEDFAFLQRNEPYLGTVTGGLFKPEVGSRIYERPEQFDVKITGKPSPFSPVCAYEDPSFVGDETALLYRYSTEFVVLSKVSFYFAKMRDHMLLMADRLSGDPLP